MLKLIVVFVLGGLFGFGAACILQANEVDEDE